MPYKDPEKRREYHRNYQRQRRAGVQAEQDGQTLNLDGIKYSTAEEVLSLLSETLTAVKNSKHDVLQKARVIGYVAAITLKAVEVAELEKRLNELEIIVKGGGQRDTGKKSVGFNGYN
jgi:hypothetical protein